MTSVEKALICAVLLALPAAISCARSAPLQQQQRVAHLSSPSSAAQLSGRRLQQALPGYDYAVRSTDASLRPDLPYAGGVGTGVVGGDAAMVDKIGTGFGEGVNIADMPETEQLIAVPDEDDAPTVGDLLLEDEQVPAEGPAPPLEEEPPLTPDADEPELPLDDEVEEEDFDEFLDWLEENWGNDTEEWNDDMMDLLREGHNSWADRHSDWVESANAFHEEMMANHQEWLDEFPLVGLAAANPLAETIADQQAFFLEQQASFFPWLGRDAGAGIIEGEGEVEGEDLELELEEEEEEEAAQPLSPADFHADMFRRQRDWHKNVQELHAAQAQAFQQQALLGSNPFVVLG